MSLAAAEGVAATRSCTAGIRVIRCNCGAEESWATSREAYGNYLLARVISGSYFVGPGIGPLQRIITPIRVVRPESKIPYDFALRNSTTALSRPLLGLNKTVKAAAK
jgi:hypothetical protein